MTSKFSFWFWVETKTFRSKRAVSFPNSLEHRNLLIVWELRFYKNYVVKPLEYCIKVTDRRAP